MKIIEINGKKRETGRKSAKSDRKQLMVPCVLYGAGKENVHFSALTTEFKPLIYTPQTYTVKINLEGQHYEAILQDVQYHPVSDKIEHIDFLMIEENKKVVISIPVHLHGFPIGVKEGGKLAQIKRKVKVRALIQHLPESVEINVEHLKIGNSIKVQDLKADNVEFLDVKNAVVASVKVTRAVVEEVTTTAAGTATAATTAAPATAAAATTDKGAKPAEKSAKPADKKK